jgi:hypothetical protein
MIIGILLYSVAVFLLSFQIVKKQQRLDQAELAMYIVLIAWGSMIFGIALFQANAASALSVASLR